jgi:CRP/FNR family cyclic AMP-dependent transcriptional regulator
MDIMPNKIVKKGQVIFTEGDEPDGVYYITEGRVYVSRMIDGAPHVIAELEAGDIFGELAMIDDSPRSATIIAAEDTWLYSLHRKVFEQKLKALDHLMYTVFLRMALCIRNMNMQIEHLNRLTTHSVEHGVIDKAAALQPPPQAQPAQHMAQQLAPTAPQPTPVVPQAAPFPSPPTPSSVGDNLSMIEDYITQPRFR